jgi:hypothetical protein
VPEEKDDAQLMLITAISAVGDSTIPTFVSTNKTFNKVSRQLSNYLKDKTIPSALQKKLSSLKCYLLTGYINVFLPRVFHLRERTKYHSKVVLILDGHATHITPRAIASAGSQGLLLIRLVPHYTHIVQSLEVYVFGF